MKASLFAIVWVGLLLHMRFWTEALSGRLKYNKRMMIVILYELETMRYFKETRVGAKSDSWQGAKPRGR
jgi:hypothetical protein